MVIIVHHVNRSGRIRKEAQECDAKEEGAGIDP